MVRPSPGDDNCGTRDTGGHCGARSVPSAQARMTLAAAPDGLQGTVAAGILGCGSVILGAFEAAGYGHPNHKECNPRVQALSDVAKKCGANFAYIHIAEAIEAVIPQIVGKNLELNVSAAIIPAVLLGVGFPLNALEVWPILARTGGIIAYLAEEQTWPVGFARRL
jgi:citrate synthase